MIGLMFRIFFPNAPYGDTIAAVWPSVIGAGVGINITGLGSSGFFYNASPSFATSYCANTSTISNTYSSCSSSDGDGNSAEGYGGTLTLTPVGYP
jgi:hypothetical protein